MTTRTVPTELTPAQRQAFEETVERHGKSFFANADLIWKTLLEAASDGWHPIETAPKDGTVIDLWHDELGRSPDCHWGVPEHCCGEAGRYCDSEWHSLKEGWVSTTFNEMTDETYTHWMPLPASPKPTDTAEKEVRDG